ncbi:hypothetical protein LCGC14_1702260 [marine sediment metagenome]|uniref:Uncharacterized protein n=1 Tax=marine sediment metagenome TaxID=412755 RepID=A0A0F9I571_9ZZZZ
MELVGQVTRTQEAEDGRLQVEFRCTNHETFCFIAPPAIQPPENELIRCFTHRQEFEDGSIGRDHILEHWEPL